MKIAICDDDARCREDALSATNECLAQLDRKAIAVEVFSHADDLMDAVEKNGGFDIYILDVVMPDTDGIALGNLLRSHGCDGKIIYLTSSDEFALHSYQVKAFDYLLKPIDHTAFSRCLGQAVSAMEEKSGKTILVKTKESLAKLNFDHILYAELCRRTIGFCLVDGKRVESTQLRSTFAEAVQELLADPRFYLLGASTVLNLQNIVEMRADAVTFKDGTSLPLSKKAVREVRSVWCEFCLSEVTSK